MVKKTQISDTFKENLECLKSLRSSVKLMESLQQTEKTRVLKLMRQDIERICGEEFCSEMRKEIPRRLRDRNVSVFKLKDNLDYLVEAILSALSGASVANSLIKFIAPGENSEKSTQFFQEFHADFVKISELFGFKLRHDFEPLVGLTIIVD